MCTCDGLQLILDTSLYSHIQFPSADTGRWLNVHMWTRATAECQPHSIFFQLLETDRGSKWRQAHVETALFYTTKDVDHLIKETEVCLICPLINIEFQLLETYFGWSENSFTDNFRSILIIFTYVNRQCSQVDLKAVIDKKQWRDYVCHR